MNTISNFMKNKKLRNWSIAVLAVVVIGLLAALFFSTNKSQAQTSTESTTESTVESLDVSETVESSGSLAAQPFASLEWKTSGVVESVNFATGDIVKTSDVLVALKPSSTSSNIVSAQADLIEAQNNLEDLLKSDTDRAQVAIDLQDAKDTYKTAKDWRTSLNGKIWTKRYTTKTVGTNEVVTVHWYRGYADPATIAEADRDLALKMSEMEDAQRAYDRVKDGPNAGDVAAAQAKVDSAQATVNSMSIIAPFEGQVLSMDDHVGDVVSSGDLSVNLADMNHLYVVAQIDESDIAKVKVGNKVTATLDAVTGLTLTGKVTAVNPVGEEVSGIIKYEVRIDLDKVADGTFIPLGTTVDTVIQVKEASTALAIPITAIQNDDKGEYVWLVKEDGSTTRVDVVGGSIVGDLVTVTGDLKEGDRISTTQSKSRQQGPGGPFGG
jgi:RND family efflux transporter MFP subunit